MCGIENITWIFLLWVTLHESVLDLLVEDIKSMEVPRREKLPPSLSTQLAIYSVLLTRAAPTPPSQSNINTFLNPYMIIMLQKYQVLHFYSHY